MVSNNSSEVEKLTVCLFGIYNPTYARNAVFIKGFKENGYTVILCNIDPRKYPGYRKYFALYKEYKKIRHTKFTYVVVCFPGQSVVWLAYLLFGKRIIFDAFLSLYESNVVDRKLYNTFHYKAFRDWVYDWYSSRLASIVMLDTETNADFFSKYFKLPRRKTIGVLVGANDAIFYPRGNRQRKEVFEVEFHGTYIPVQGVEYVIRAANILRNKNVHFTLIGDGQEKESVVKLADELNVQNVTFLPAMSQDEITKYIQNADVCIGLLGTTPRALRSIPNKVYEAAAMERVSINVDSPALREVFTPGKDTLAIEPGNFEELAHVIDTLITKKNGIDMGKCAYDTYLKYATPKHIVKTMTTKLEKNYNNSTKGS